MNKFRKTVLAVIVLMCFFILNSLQTVRCEDSITIKLNNIEKTYYGYTYSDNTEKRLQRLEKNVYGVENPNPKLSQQSRVDKLCKDLDISTDSDSITTANNYEDIGPKADVGIKYPIVDMMEQKLFQKSYTHEDIYDRLSRLEQKTFVNSNTKNKNASLSLNERVDLLKNKILGGTRVSSVYIDPSKEEIILENGQRYYGDYEQKFKTFEEDEISHYNYYSYDNSKNRIPNTQTSSVYDPFNNLTGNNTGFAYNPNRPNYPEYPNNIEQEFSSSYDLDILEKSILGKNYRNDTPSGRLARLESKVFSRTFDDGQEARIQRLLAVSTAQKTSQEYDSNKWARRLNAGLQIGGILLMVLCMIL